MTNIKKLSLFLAALTVASSMATAVSAGGVFLPRPDQNNTDKDTSYNDKAEDKEEDIVETSSGFIWNTQNVFKKSTAKKSKYTFTAPSRKKPYKYGSCNIAGGKYLSPEDAKKELEKYFNENSYDMYFKVGDERTFCEGAYFYSTDPDVISYDYKTGKLVAHKVGSADVYVYTSGGVPFFRLDCSVDRKPSKKQTPTLDVVPADWNIEIGETTTFTITASDGKVYNDIELSIWHGSDNARLGGQSGILTAVANGPVVIHAASKSNKNIYGDALVYIGSYTGAVPEGSWSKYNGGIKINGWKDDICGSGYGKVCGWIKSAEGILIPVIRFENATYTDYDGTKKETIIITGGLANLYDLLRNAYGNKGDIADIIKKYNLLKYGIPTKETYTYEDIDMTSLILSSILQDILG